MKKISIVIVVLFGMFFTCCGFSAWYDTCALKSFKATAYYSPQEGQKFYIRWSLEEDIILNGSWTHGASWKPVFNGMIAAPKSYAFGTRLYVPWRWIGQIEDRGGAIVEAWERNESFDRLDFWAGEWQAWLVAALRFWVRYFDAYVCPKWVWGNTLGFSFDHIPLEKKWPATLREIDLSPGMISSRTPILQRYLKTLWYMEDIPESFHYGEQTMLAVCQYQQKEMWMSSSSEWCGRFWARTRRALFESVQQFSQGAPDTKKSVEQNLAWDDSSQQKTSYDYELNARLFAYWGEFDWYVFGPLAPGDTGKEVRILQRKLQWLGYYPKDEAITWVYDAQTIRSVYAFQLAEWLLVAGIDPWVYGYLGPKTRAKINSV